MKTETEDLSTETGVRPFARLSRALLALMCMITQHRLIDHFVLEFVETENEWGWRHVMTGTKMMV